MNIKFKNGTKFDYIAALETEEYFNGASRRTLTFDCAVGAVSVDELNSLLSDEANTAQIVLTNPEGVPVYKTQPVLSEQTDENGETVMVETGETEFVYDENGQPIVDHYEEVANIYDGYVLKLKCGIESKLIEAETPENTAVYEDRLVFKLGKRTYIEEQLKRLGL